GQRRRWRCAGRGELGAISTAARHVGFRRALTTVPSDPRQCSQILDLARFLGTGDDSIMRFVSIIALAGGLLGGCIVQGPDEVEASQQVETSNRLALNRLALNHLAAVTLASDRLSTGKIANSS